jgi:hypothetical protein
MKEAKMKVAQGQPVHSIAREKKLLGTLEEAGAFRTDELSLTIADHHLFLDGFVESLDEKLRAERLCHELSPEFPVVNRLRIASTLERKVS